MPTDTQQKRTRRRAPAKPSRDVAQGQATPLEPPPLAARQDPDADPVEAANQAAQLAAPGLPEVPAGSSDPEPAVEAAPDSDDVRWLLGHLRGCPEQGSIARVETYEVQAPEKQGGGMVLVVRCQECGAHARADELTENY